MEILIPQQMHTEISREAFSIQSMKIGNLYLFYRFYVEHIRDALGLGGTGEVAFDGRLRRGGMKKKIQNKL